MTDELIEDRLATLALVTVIAVSAVIAYHLDGSLGGHGPVITTGQPAISDDLPPWIVEIID